MDMHAEFGGALQVESTVIDETRLFGGNLRCLKGQSIDVALRLSQAYKTRADEEPEYFPECELVHAMVVQLTRLVVDRRHEVVRESLNDFANSSIPGSGWESEYM